MLVHTESTQLTNRKGQKKVDKGLSPLPLLMSFFSVKRRLSIKLTWPLAISRLTVLCSFELWYMLKFWGIRSLQSKLTYEWCGKIPNNRILIFLFSGRYCFLWNSSKAIRCLGALFWKYPFFMKLFQNFKYQVNHNICYQSFLIVALLQTRSRSICLFDWNLL